MRRRSMKDHRMYWSIIRVALKNWPHDHPFQPHSEEHLHGWLLIQVNHRKCVEVETKDVAVAKVVAKGIFDVTQREIHCMRIFDAGTGIRICVPDSFKDDDAGKRKYEDVRRAVYEVITATLGVEIEEIKRARGTHADG